MFSVGRPDNVSLKEVSVGCDTSLVHFYVNLAQERKQSYPPPTERPGHTHGQQE